MRFVGYNWSNKTMSTLEGRILTYHRIAEAFKFAYARRSQLGDMDFVDVSEVHLSKSPGADINFSSI